MGVRALRCLKWDLDFAFWDEVEPGKAVRGTARQKATNSWEGVG